MIHERIPLTVPDADGPAELITYAPDRKSTRLNSSH